MNNEEQQAVFDCPDVVYRVVEFDDTSDEHADAKITDGGPTTWLVEARKVERVRRDGSIQLERPFSDISRRIYRPSSLGTTFFATEREAVDEFQRLNDANIERYNRGIARSNRAIGWARVWRHHNVVPQQAYPGKP